ncbi:MAG: HAD family phosphatase [Candidatus Aenigmarchaeota archaeon]|nr:HAD family phosphatase [Candidatus Aenigmarchaeota archaeon]
MRTDDAIGTRGRASEYTPAGDSNRSISARPPVKAVIFDIGDVVTRPKYGRAYKGAMRRLDGMLARFAGEGSALRSFVINQRRAYRLNEGVLAIIDRLHAAGYVTPSITNTPSKRFERDERLRGNKVFDGVVESAKLGISKPDRRIYEHALRRFNLRPDECVFVDDKEENLAPAAAMGMQTVLFRSAKQLKDDLRKYGVRI